jgi:hypothetical protein
VANNQATGKSMLTELGMLRMLKMVKRLFLLMAIVFTLFACQKENPQDYRDQYTGDWDLAIFTFGREVGDTISDDNYDTTFQVATISKFEGYSCGTGSNFYDIEHKIGIQLWPDFSFESCGGSCNDTLYYINGYLHPTVTIDGLLSYPEFTCDFHAYFNGRIDNDSIQINYGYHGLGGQWTKTISGAKLP